MFDFLGFDDQHFLHDNFDIAEAYAILEMLEESERERYIRKLIRIYGPEVVELLNSNYYDGSMQLNELPDNSAKR